MKKLQFRQGDVLIERIAKLPKELKAADPIQGKTILAYGEVTGHHHAFSEDECAKFIAVDGAEFFQVKGRKIQIRLPILRHWKNQVMVNHPKFGLIEFAEDTVEINGDYCLISGEFGLLKHDEHNTQGIPAGLYKGAGADKTVHQREYSPSEIRRVAD